ncbi:MAG: LamG-like jellyroll fold domain-containing protein, partial [Planctomycetota bacterium]
QDPNRVEDDHWFMTEYYGERSTYKDTPRYPLQGSGLSVDSYVDGTVEDWTEGALELTAEQSLRVAHSTLVAPFTTTFGKGKKQEEKTFSGADKRTVDMQENDFLIEVLIKPAGDGSIVQKVDGTGYELRIDGGAAVLRLSDGDAELTATGPKLARGVWSHLVVEVYRDGGVRMALDGEPARVSSDGSMPGGSLSNGADFVVGDGLAATFDYLRVCRGTLEDARTTAAELHAWQFDGPFLKDFTGRQREPGRSAAGAIASP